jgi:hypothetical protein
MQAKGFRLLGTANNQSELEINAETPDWVVINGEGSFHHNSTRIKELLDLGLEFQARGSRVALVNSLWESNVPQLAEPLRKFDLVSVRDSRSANNLAELGISTFLTPDLSFEEWMLPEEHSPLDLLFTDCIVFERTLGLFDAMLRLGGDFLVLDDRQLSRMNDEGCLAALPTHRVAMGLLKGNGPLQHASLIVTGRFHVVVGCVALQKPFLFVESNTHKISELCRDVGLPEAALNITREIESRNWRELERKIRELRSEFPSLIPRLNRYRNVAVQQLEGLFDFLTTAQRHAA